MAASIALHQNTYIHINTPSRSSISSHHLTHFNQSILSLSLSLTMASSHQILFLVISSLLILSDAQPSFRPKALVLPVAKDPSTLQYLTKLNQRTPLVPLDLVLDLGGQHFWVDCEKNFTSSTYRPARCRSAQCSLARSNGCTGQDICGTGPLNSVTRTSTFGEIGDDIVTVSSTDGSTPGRSVTVSRFIFVCAPTLLTQGLASQATGMAGLGRTRVALPTQFASAFSFPRKFAICLSSTTANGVIFLGDGPYNLLPNVDASESLTFTPLLTNTIPDLSVEYFIGVKSIKVNDKVVPLNASLLSIDNGGTKISTVDPYTVLETSIYNAVIESFVNEAASLNITRVPSVAPFGACFNAKNIFGTRLGPRVPFIELVLQSEKVVWTITGSNSMVEINSDVSCLAMVDGGLNPRTSIVLGGLQLENTLLQFDLATSRLGFSYSLNARQTTCANFNFTSTP